MPANLHIAEPFRSILNDFAEATSNMAREASYQRFVSREVHHDPSGERPEGDGWTKVSTDRSGYSVWERWSTVRVPL